MADQTLAAAVQMMLEEQRKSSAALQSLAAALQNLGSGSARPRLTSGRGSRGRGGARGGRSGRPTSSARGPIVEVRDVATQRDVALRATQKNRVRTALRQMSTAIFTEDKWDVVRMCRWYNAALRCYGGLVQMDFPAGQQKEDFFEQVRQISLGFNEGRLADDPKAVLRMVAKTIRELRGPDSFYDDGHVKIQSADGRPINEGELGEFHLTGFTNVRLKSNDSGTHVPNAQTSIGWEILSSLDDETDEALPEGKGESRQEAEVKPPNPVVG